MLLLKDSRGPGPGNKGACAAARTHLLTAAQSTGQRKTASRGFSQVCRQRCVSCEADLNHTWETAQLKAVWWVVVPEGSGEPAPHLGTEEGAEHPPRKRQLLPGDCEGTRSLKNSPKYTPGEKKSTLHMGRAQRACHSSDTVTQARTSMPCSSKNFHPLSPFQPGATTVSKGSTPFR